MAYRDRPDVTKLTAQEQALLKGFMDAGIYGLTTAQLLGFTYQQEDRAGLLRTKHIGDWRARKSALLKLGYLITKTAVPNSGQFRYVLVGFCNDLQLPLELQEARQ